MERLHGCVFKTIAENFIQDGLSIVERDLSGHEFDVNHFGDLVGEKRYGITPSVWVFDQTNRGRRGDQGLKGPRGVKGESNDFVGISAGALALELANQGKRLITNKTELAEAFRNPKDGWVLPMSKSLFMK
jgi:hypothetical protein